MPPSPRRTGGGVRFPCPVTDIRMRAFRPLALAGATLLAATTLASAQSGDPEPTALEFHGFRPGARLDEIDSLVTRRAARLRCDRAKADRRVTECRAALDRRELGGRTDLWVSAVDSVASVLTLSGPADADRLQQWRRTLEQHYGHVQARSQGQQSMMQWVRRGKMLRLTWRVDGARTIASVSLVDGRVLDAWGHSRPSQVPAQRGR
jgi:hypothetical protein